MAGYRWHVVVRYTPRNGFVETFDFTQGFLASGSTVSVLAFNELEYEAELEERVSARFRSHPLRRGFRPRSRMQFDIIRDMSHQADVFRLCERLMEPRWVVELSLNGGSIYREIVSAGSPTVEPIQKKTIAGVRHRVPWEAVDLIRKLRPFASGTAW